MLVVTNNNGVHCTVGESTARSMDFVCTGAFCSVVSLRSGHARPFFSYDYLLFFFSPYIKPNARLCNTFPNDRHDICPGIAFDLPLRVFVDREHTYMCVHVPCMYYRTVRRKKFQTHMAANTKTRGREPDNDDLRGPRAE